MQFTNNTTHNKNYVNKVISYFYTVLDTSP